MTAVPFDCQVSELIGLFYESVLDESKWIEALKQLCAFVGGTGYAHVVADPVAQKITQCKSFDVAPEFDRLYLDYFSTREVRMAPALPQPVGAVMTERTLIEKRELERSEIYSDLLLPYDAPHFMIAWVQKQISGFQTIAMEGSRRHGEFQREQIERLQLLMPHIVRAVSMREMMISARSTGRALREAMEHLPFAVAFLDQTGRVVDATSTAERVLRKGDGLFQRNQRVEARFPQDDARLQKTLGDMLQERISCQDSNPRLVIRRAHRAHLTLNILRLTKERISTITPQPALALLIGDPESAEVPTTSVIQTTLQITRAEAQLAGKLFTGISLREAANELQVSINTCKTQLKSIYEKTGCRSHVDLTKRLVLASLSARGVHLIVSMLSLGGIASRYLHASL